ncbi:hypothetical protein AX16_003092 [Volvariella volvacea WC 439]|nr:hypothetical protein AX16_003092 [Volvariella volvacea WC 439]
MASPLHQLVELLNKAVADLDAVTAQTATKIPDLNEPFHPTSEAFRLNPVAAEATTLIGAAALHVAAVVLPPQVTIANLLGGPAKSAALRVCLESNVTEILREAGPKGLHVNEIAAQNGQDPKKLVRFLRLLATNLVYREVEPNVFANNRLSSMFDTLKPSKEIFADPELNVVVQDIPIVVEQGKEVIKSF